MAGLRASLAQLHHDDIRGAAGLSLAAVPIPDGNKNLAVLHEEPREGLILSVAGVLPHCPILRVGIGRGIQWQGQTARSPFAQFHKFGVAGFCDEIGPIEILGHGQNRDKRDALIDGSTHGDTIGSFGQARHQKQRRFGIALPEVAEDLPDSFPVPRGVCGVEIAMAGDGDHERNLAGNGREGWHRGVQKVV